MMITNVVGFSMKVVIVVCRDGNALFMTSLQNLKKDGKIGDGL